MLRIPYLNKLTDGVHCNRVPHESNTQLYIAWWRRGIVAVVTQIVRSGAATITTALVIDLGN